MGYSEAIKKAKEEIESSVERMIETGECTDVDQNELARRSGYSFYHFLHVFRAIEGTGVSSYIRKVKLARSRELLEQNAKVTDVAFTLGFDTPSGFTRAFEREFGVSPSAYQKENATAFSRAEGDIVMEPRFEKKAAFRALCHVIRPENEIDILENGGYWIGKDIPGVTTGDGVPKTHEDAFKNCPAKIGAWMHDNDGRELYYVYGDELGASGEAETSGQDAAVRIIDFPEAEYAVFDVPKASDHEGFIKNLKDTWKYIFKEWFDGSGYSFDEEKADFEYYTLHGVSIYVPVK